MNLAFNGPKYRNREDAGKVLASRLVHYRNKGAIVLAIPNGGVPVGAVVAEALEGDLYLMLVRKLQIPDNPEAGFGAVTSDGFLMLNKHLIQHLSLTDAVIERQKEKALESIGLRQNYFGKRAELPPLASGTVILVDDGLASGFTMEVAVKSARNQGAERVVIAVPTSSRSAYQRLKPQVDELICPDIGREGIFAVANAYQKWYDVNEDEVLSILQDLRIRGRGDPKIRDYKEKEND